MQQVHPYPDCTMLEHTLLLFDQSSEWTQNGGWKKGHSLYILVIPQYIVYCVIITIVIFHDNCDRERAIS